MWRHVIWTAAIDPRVKCVVSCVGVGHGARWMRSVRRPDEWVDLQALSKKDREARVLTGKSEMVERAEILLADRQSAALATAARKANPNAINTLPLEYIDETLQFHPEWRCRQDRPAPAAAHHDRRRPAWCRRRSSEALYAKRASPRSSSP